MTQQALPASSAKKSMRSLGLIGLICGGVLLLLYVLYNLIYPVASSDFTKSFSEFMAPLAIPFLVIGGALILLGLVLRISGKWQKGAVHHLGIDLLKNKWLYIMLIPGLLYFLVFKYLPMWGIIISFENYTPFKGPLASEWRGLYWFIRFFSTKKWWTYLSNTLILSFMSIIFTFPAPIILALMLNEIRSIHYKKVTQTLLYVPHFISIVIVVSITYVIFGADGIIYKLTTQMLGHSVDYLGDPKVFRWMIVGQSIWKETGWGTIIFLAALTNVDTQLYEASMIDGANRAQRLWHITLPAIRSTIVLMLVLRMGSVLDTGYEHLILMSNALNRSVSQTLDVFVYQNGIGNGQFSYTTAVGLMKSLVSVVMVISANKIAHALGEDGLY